MASHQEVNIYGSIYGILEDTFNEIKEILEAAFDHVKYKCGSVIIESFEIHRNLDSTFDLIASSITTEEQSYLEMDPCGPEIQYRTYFKKDIWEAWEPEFVWPEDPFDDKKASESHSVLTINKNDAFVGLQEYRARIARDDDDETIDAQHNAVMSLSDEDMAAIAKNLGQELLCYEEAATLFWESLGEFVQTVLDANEKKTTPTGE